jgi:hypothetical protein
MRKIEASLADVQERTSTASRVAGGRAVPAPYFLLIFVIFEPSIPRPPMIPVWLKTKA